MKIQSSGHLTQNLYTKFTLHLKEKIFKQLHWPSVTKKPLYFLAVQDFSSPSLSPWKMLLFFLLDKLLLIANHARSILVSLKQTNASQQKTKFSLANENLLTHLWICVIGSHIHLNCYWTSTRSNNYHLEWTRDHTHQA